MYSHCSFCKRFTFKNRFRITVKLKGRYRDFPYNPCLHTNIASFIINTPHQRLGENRHKGYLTGVMEMPLICKTGEFDGMQTMSPLSCYKKCQERLKAGKYTPLVGKAFQREGAN